MHDRKETAFQSQHHDQQVAERLRQRYQQIGIPAVRAAATMKSTQAKAAQKR
ncbi:hypothetical protein J2R99_000540 [Rhodopseudomonas julia]|uniref:Transposase n=1 Tax=Rhodopseudomonas julia TaxID=200617 RepID=A0ABU0C2E8_9BRAD|nr:hypothetical protein [Rhodopseudomonas julia]MDQ0324691.1 hypothetical protein [Rhodopseudomonas julia]